MTSAIFTHIKLVVRVLVRVCVCVCVCVCAIARIKSRSLLYSYRCLVLDKVRYFIFLVLTLHI